MEIAELQAGLKALGLNPGPIDGLARPGGTTFKAIDALLERNKARLVPTFKPTNARKLVAAEQLIYWSAGFSPGAIDGFVGPSTLEARRQWQAKVITGKPAEPWRDQLMDARPTDKVLMTAWPRQADVVKFFGNPGENLTRLTPPYAMRLDWDLKTPLKTYEIHERCHDSAVRVFTRVLSHYGLETIRALGLDRWAGCFNIRKMRGGTKMSMHSWGIAHDFWAAKNQLQWGSDKAEFAKPAYDVWWRLWTEEGWLSLGKARNFDWMHVQAARL